MINPTIKFYTAALMLLFALVSCEKNNELEVHEETRAVVFKSNMLPMSKATENAFEISDAISVCIVKTDGNVYADNNKFIYDGSVLKSESGLNWYQGSTPCTIVACYPYKSDYSYKSSYVYDAAVDQSSYSAFLASDLLVATADNITPGSGPVKLSFAHRCTQFQVNVKNQSSESIQSVKFLSLEYHQVLTAGFKGTSGGNVMPTDIIPYHTSSGGVDTYKAFVPSLQTNLFQVEIKTSGGTHLYKVKEKFCFASGTIYIVNISLNDKVDAQEVSVLPQFEDWKTKDITVYEDGDDGDEGDESYFFASYQDMYSAGRGKTYSSSTPMGTHYVGAHVTTQSDRNWLLEPSNEPSTLPSAPNYTWKEYSVTLYPFGTPSPADVNQHGIGDCSACAVFAEMAYVAPGFIKSIITDNGDKTYTVKMYDPQGQPLSVCVSSKFLGSSSIGAVTGKNNVACWSTILEKAMMKWEAIYKVNPDVYGIGSEHVAPLFTGEGDSFAFYPGDLTASQLKDAVNLSFKSKCLIIGGFNQGGVYVGSSQTVTAHAYSFHKDSGSKAMFAMRNPWGYSPGESTYADGLLHITDDGKVPPLIDIRVICAGALASYYNANLEQYTPPTYSGLENYQMLLMSERESSWTLKTGINGE